MQKLGYNRPAVLFLNLSFVFLSGQSSLCSSLIFFFLSISTYNNVAVNISVNIHDVFDVHSDGHGWRVLLIPSRSCKLICCEFLKFIMQMSLAETELKEHVTLKPRASSEHQRSQSGWLKCKCKWPHQNTVQQLPQAVQGDQTPHNNPTTAVLTPGPFTSLIFFLDAFVHHKKVIKEGILNISA